MNNLRSSSVCITYNTPYVLITCILYTRKVDKSRVLTKTNENGNSSISIITICTIFTYIKSLRTNEASHGRVYDDSRQLSDSRSCSEITVKFRPPADLAAHYRSSCIVGIRSVIQDVSRIRRSVFSLTNAV